MGCEEFRERVAAPYDGRGAEHHEDGSEAKFGEEVHHAEECKGCFEFLNGLPCPKGIRLGRRQINPWFAK